VFLSLDSGDGDANPETRTFEAVRRTELGRDVSRLHKGRHWYITHEFSLRLLGQFQPALSIDTVLQHIAHVNTVKCSANLPHRSQAPPQMYRNCRHHIFEELRILQPDILVSQGAEARKAVEDLFRCAPFHPLEAEGATGGLGLLHGLHDWNTLWIQMHHPSARGGVFQKQKEHMWPRYVSSARRFVEAREL
jgi:uracil-DNA glycosylase